MRVSDLCAQWCEWSELTTRGRNGSGSGPAWCHHQRQGAKGWPTLLELIRIGSFGGVWRFGELGWLGAVREAVERAVKKEEEREEREEKK